MRNSPLFRVRDKKVPQLLALEVGGIRDGDCAAFRDHLGRSIRALDAGEARVLHVIEHGEYETRS